MRCTKGELINGINPAAGHANKNECAHILENSGELPRIIYVTHRVISEEMENDIFLGDELHLKM
ncbi:MAG: hypothetical protein ACI910_003056 [Oleispira sp.]|jgi:hypothetical protein